MHPHDSLTGENTLNHMPAAIAKNTYSLTLIKLIQMHSPSSQLDYKEQITFNALTPTESGNQRYKPHDCLIALETLKLMSIAPITTFMASRI